MGAHTGDWRVSPLIHPDGLKVVADAAHRAGKKFLLWFEPERVICTTPIAKEHPEYFLKVPQGTKNPSRMLNLGLSEAWKYCYRTLSGLIREIGIDAYRQDFNFDPLNHWRYNDTEDRRGITEIKHINGMYRLWDKLLEDFPHLLIDNCASGGRRIDIETLRRSVPLWRSDLQCSVNCSIAAAQNFEQAFNLWMPFSGTGCGRLYDEYRIRSSYAAAMTTNYSYYERESFCEEKEQVDFIKKYTAEYLRVRPYLSEDFYPLTQVGTATDIWVAMQFDRPEQKDGIIRAFRRENSPYEQANFFLHGICEDREYCFEDADGGEFRIGGKRTDSKRTTLGNTRKKKGKNLLLQGYLKNGGGRVYPGFCVMECYMECYT